MKRLNGIIESEFAPSSKNDMWLYKGSLKYFGPSGWADVKTLTQVTPATTTEIGGVRQAANVAKLATGAELTAVVTKVNAILSALKVADIMVKD